MTEAGPGLLSALRRYAFGILLATALGAATAYGLSQLQPVRYAAETTVFLDDPNTRPSILSAQGFSDPARFVRNSVDIAMSKRVGDRVFEILSEGLPEEELVYDYEAETLSSERDVFTVRATAPTPESAIATVAAVVTGYRETALVANTQAIETLLADFVGRLQTVDARQRELLARIGAGSPTFAEQQRVESNSRDLEAINAQIASYQQQIESVGDGVRFVDVPVASAQPVQPRPLQAAVLGGVVMLLLAAGLAWWRLRSARTIEDRNEAAAILRAPLLGEVPDFSSAGVSGVVPAASAPFSRAGEAYQFLVSSLLYTLRDGEKHTVLVTSAEPGDGKSVTALNLAIAAARDEQRVVVVDADARVRGLTRLAEIESHSGLTDLTDVAVPVEKSIVRVRIDDAEVDVVPLGERVIDHAGFFRSSAFRTALQRIREHADLILVDSPPLLAVAETSAVAGQVDGIVLVVGRGTSVRSLQDVAERLEFIGAPLLGYVYNRGRTARGGGYGYGYGYGGEPDQPAQAEKPSRPAASSSKGSRRKDRSAAR